MPLQSGLFTGRNQNSRPLVEHIVIERAAAADHSVLTQISFESKAFWGYSAAQLEIWKDDLIITPEYITQNHLFKMVLNSDIIGFYPFIRISDDHIILEHLFVLPEYIGKGFGKNLLDHFLKIAEDLKSKSITLEADPHAESFYKKFGFTTFGYKESSVAGRFLPQMIHHFK